MKKNNVKKTPKSRRPLYYVDNPNKHELTWLDDIQKNPKPISVHGSAAPVQKPVERQAGSKPGRVDTKAGGNHSSQEVPVSSEFVSSRQQTEEIVAIATSHFPVMDSIGIEEMPDIIAVVDSMRTDSLQSADALVELLREEMPEIESEQVVFVEEQISQEARHSKLEEKRMPQRPSPIVYTDDVANEAITGEKLAPYTVGAVQLAGDSVYTNSLADFAVTAIK
jgi:hypothetical protein